MNNQNKLMLALCQITATLKPAINRVKQAKLSVLGLLGTVPEGAVTSSSIYARGAGQGPAGHTMEQKSVVGSRSFTRKQRNFVNTMRYTAWGRHFR